MQIILSRFVYCANAEAFRKVRHGRTIDFRGIAISNILSKMFESCLLDIFGSWLYIDDNQFGCKKGLGCTNSIYAANCFASSLVPGRYTVIIVALDIVKAFPSVSRHALLIKVLKM